MAPDHGINRQDPVRHDTFIKLFAEDKTSKLGDIKGNINNAVYNIFKKSISIEDYNQQINQYFKERDPSEQSLKNKAIALGSVYHADSQYNKKEGLELPLPPRIKEVADILKSEEKVNQLITNQHALTVQHFAKKEPKDLDDIIAPIYMQFLKDKSESGNTVTYTFHIPQDNPGERREIAGDKIGQALHKDLKKHAQIQTSLRGMDGKTTNVTLKISVLELEAFNNKTQIVQSDAAIINHLNQTTPGLRWERNENGFNATAIVNAATWQKGERLVEANHLKGLVGQFSTVQGTRRWMPEGQVTVYCSLTYTEAAYIARADKSKAFRGPTPPLETKKVETPEIIEARALFNLKENFSQADLIKVKRDVLAKHPDRFANPNTIEDKETLEYQKIKEQYDKAHEFFIKNLDAYNLLFNYVTAS